MLARGNSDAAAQLRRAKSTSSSVQHHSFISDSEAISTYDNAKTAATKAYEAAHGFLAEGCAPRTRRKSKSEGPGSHFAKQRLSARKATIEQSRTPRRKAGCQNLSLEATPQDSPRSSPFSFRYENSVDQDSSTTERARIDAPQSDFLEDSPRDARGGSRRQPQWQTGSPQRVALNRGPTPRKETDSFPDGFEAVPLFAAPAQSQGIEGDPPSYSSNACVHAMERLDSSNVAASSSKTPKPRTSLFFSKPRLRSKSSARKASNAHEEVEANIEQTNQTRFRQTMQRIPSSLSAVKDACKRKLGRTSRTSSARSEFPNQQVDCRRSHHFGSSRMSDRSLFAGFSGNAIDVRMNGCSKARPPTPPQHDWPVIDRSNSAQSNGCSHQDSDGALPDSSRISSWENTSGYGTAKFSERPDLENAPQHQERTALQRLHLRHQISYSSIPKLRISRRKSSSGFNTPGVNTQRVYSALIKRISESDDHDMKHTADAAQQRSRLSQKASLPALPEMSPSLSIQARRTSVRSVHQTTGRSDLQPSDSTHDVDLDPKSNSVSEPNRENIASPSVYSPYPRPQTSTAKMSSLSLAGADPTIMGTAIVSPSKPFVSYNLNDTPKGEPDSHVVTSGEWRDWANTEMSGLELLEFRPPSIHIRGPTTDDGNEERPPTPPVHGDPRLIHPAKRSSVLASQLPGLANAGETQRPTGHHIPQKTDNIQSRQTSNSNIPIRRPSSSTTLRMAPNSKAFAFARRPSFITIDKARLPSVQSSPLREQTPSLTNVRNPSNMSTNENAPPETHVTSGAQTPEWVPSLRSTASQPLRTTTSHVLKENKPASPSPLTQDFLRSIRKGPYADSTSSASTRTTPSPGKMARTPRDLAELRMRRTRRGRKSLVFDSQASDGRASGDGGHERHGMDIWIGDKGVENSSSWIGEGGREMVDGFLKERIGDLGGGSRCESGEDGAFL
ncbi:MAG: hypothetical protein Q9162_002875 [Coniocarpon cinnabarinum]